MPKGVKVELTEEQKAAKKAAAQAAKAENFKRLAAKRMNNALKAIALIGSLGNRNQYAYTDAQVDIMEKALDNEVGKAINKFAAGVKIEQSGFSFDAVEPQAQTAE